MGNSAGGCHCGAPWWPCIVGYPTGDMYVVVGETWLSSMSVTGNTNIDHSPGPNIPSVLNAVPCLGVHRGDSIVLAVCHGARRRPRLPPLQYRDLRLFRLLGYLEQPRGIRPVHHCGLGPFLFLHGRQDVCRATLAPDAENCHRRNYQNHYGCCHSHGDDHQANPAIRVFSLALRVEPGVCGGTCHAHACVSWQQCRRCQRPGRVSNLYILERLVTGPGL